MCLCSVVSLTLGSTNFLFLVPWVELRVEPWVGPGEEEGVGLGRRQGWSLGRRQGWSLQRRQGRRHRWSLSRRNLRRGGKNSFEFCLKFLRRWHCFHIILNEKEKETNYEHKTTSRKHINLQAPTSLSLCQTPLAMATLWPIHGRTYDIVLFRHCTTPIIVNFTEFAYFLPRSAS